MPGMTRRGVTRGANAVSLFSNPGMAIGVPGIIARYPASATSRDVGSFRPATSFDSSMCARA